MDTTPFPFLEIDITTRCNLGCFQCNRSCAPHQAPSPSFSDDMSVQQIQTFILQSEALLYPWQRIRILGGEPTLHPHLLEILGLLQQYRLRSLPALQLELSTNGMCADLVEVLQNLQYLRVRNMQKVSPLQSGFTLFNLAPVDRAQAPGSTLSDCSKGCDMIRQCGLGLGRSGFYPCAAAASTDRVFGLDCGIKELALVNPTTIAAQANLLCRYCGFLGARNVFRENHTPSELTQVSPTWARAYQAYKVHPPRLSLF